jgi:hypothetical protein
MFSQAERDLMERYANLQRQLTPKARTVNYSNSGVLMSALKGTANSLAVMLGASVGGPIGALIRHAAGPLGTKLRETLAARALKRSLYQRPTLDVPVSPAWRRQTLINAVVAAQDGAAAQPDRSPKFSTAPQ